MSEDFDKEAERKRLREKYEAEREDREATERMSELLLQGATMTNKHCDVCGSPIFRYQGQAFCPNCQEERGEGAGSDETDTPQQQAQEDSATGATTGTSGTPQEARGAGTDEQSFDAAPTGGEEMPQGPPQIDEQPEDSDPSHSRAPQPAASGSVEEAQAALVRTLTDLARRAEQTDDPRQAKELLAAAREAAETLARLRGR